MNLTKTMLLAGVLCLTGCTVAKKDILPPDAGSACDVMIKEYLKKIAPAQKRIIRIDGGVERDDTLYFMILDKDLAATLKANGLIDFPNLEPVSDPTIVSDFKRHATQQGMWIVLMPGSGVITKAQIFGEYKPGACVNIFPEAIVYTGPLPMPLF